MSQNHSVYLLTIQGQLASNNLEAGRALHNETAGAPANIAGAKSLGDLSHNVYVPMDPARAEKGELMFLDMWSSIEGLNQFFSIPQVQEQAGHIFSQRDPQVWEPAEGFYTYHLTNPYGKNKRYVGIVRGMVKSRQEAQVAHNGIVSQLVNMSRAAGNMSHDAYFRASPPGSPESLEFCAVDVWMDGFDISQTYQNPDFLNAFQQLFAGPPSAGVWVHPAGDWAEW